MASLQEKNTDCVANNYLLSVQKFVPSKGD